MRTDQIRKMIQKAKAEEARHGQVADLLRQRARQGGSQPSKKDIANAVSWVREYVEHVPYYIEQGIATAANVGLGPQMAQMCGELEAYWFEPNDLIPDHHGLLGLLDDAYVSLVLLQAISDYCLSTVGQPILSQDLTAANQAMRGVIGEQIASLLEQRVGVTIGQAMMQQLMAQIATSGGFFFGNTPDPMWGNATMDEVVDARLGAMGFV